MSDYREEPITAQRRWWRPASCSRDTQRGVDMEQNEAFPDSVRVHTHTRTEWWVSCEGVVGGFCSHWVTSQDSSHCLSVCPRFRFTLTVDTQGGVLLIAGRFNTTPNKRTEDKQSETNPTRCLWRGVVTPWASKTSASVLWSLQHVPRFVEQMSKEPKETLQPTRELSLWPLETLKFSTGHEKILKDF